MKEEFEAVVNKVLKSELTAYLGYEMNKVKLKKEAILEMEYLKEN